MLESYPLITTIVASVTLAFLFGLLAHRLKLPTILGYLLAGMMIGPNTPGFIANINLATQLAEIGVILLMFGVGLNFSIKDLMSVRKIAIPGAVAQILVTTLICLLVAMILNRGLLESLVFGITLSVASTVVLIRALEQHKIINTHIGKIAIGWLVIEDIVMILILVLIPVLSSVMLENKVLDQYLILKIIFLTIVKIIAFIIIMIVFGKKLLPKLLSAMANTGSRELMILGVITISCGFAFIAYTLFGASFALGAFMAGFVLNESKIGRKSAENSLPLRDIFAVLFFVSVGMLFNPKIILLHPYLIIVAFSLVVIVKAIVAYFIMRIFRQKFYDSLVLAVSLAQIGEFSFILAALALKLEIFSHVIYDAVVTAAILSITINPFLFRIIDRFKLKNS